MAKSASANRRNDDNKINIGIKITLIAVAVLCVFMLGYTLVDSMGIMDRNTTAMTVGEDEISVSELNQYYHTTRNGFLSQYGSMLSMYGYTLDSTFDMQTSMFDSTKTWKQYFLEQAKSAAEEVSLLYNEAKAAGYTMSADDQAQYDLYMETLKDAAEENNMSVKKYCKALYGNGTKLSDVEAYYQKRVLTAGYYNTIVEGFGIDDAAIDTYYAENPDDYDQLNFYSYDVEYETVTYKADSTEEGAAKSEEEAKQRTEDNKAIAKQEADKLMALLKADGSNFDEVFADYENVELEKFTTAKGQTTVSAVDTESATGEWLGGDRKAGDMTVIDNETASAMTVMLYLDRALSDDYTVAVRHTLVAFETLAEDATEEEVKAYEAANEGKKGEAEALYEEWKAAGATEEGFIELAKEHSADSNASQGGIYTGVYVGQMTQAFEDWCFDETRQPGDHGIVETEYGYHIMYFVENEGPSYRSAIRSTLTDTKYSEYLEGIREKVEVTFNDKAISLM